MKRRKPKKKGYYFAKHGLRFFILFLALGYAGLHFWHYSTYKSYERDSLEDFIYLKGNVEEVLRDDTFARKEALISLFQRNGYSWQSDGGWIASVAGKSYLFDKETGEIVCGNREYQKMGVVIRIIDDLVPEEVKKTTNSVAKYYKDAFYCDFETLERYLTYASERMEYWKEHMPEMEGNYDRLEIRSRLDAFYYQDSRFLPARISLYCVSVRKSGQVSERKLLEEIEIDLPKPEGYEYYEIDYTSEHLFREDVIKSLLDAGNLYETKIDMEAVSKRALEAIEKVEPAYQYEKEYSQYGGSLLFPWRGAIEFAWEGVVVDASGHAYRLACYTEYYESFWFDAFGRGHFQYFILLVFLCLLGTLVFAELEYRKKRYVFLTEGYRDTLVDSMAHDLKSPLMAISGYAENLKESVKQESMEKSGYYAEKICDNVTYLNGLVTKNLEILKFDHQVKKLVREPVDVRKLFEEALERYQVTIEQRKLTLKLEGEMKAKGDKELLRTVADNLVTNAIRYASEGSEIKLSFSKYRFVIQNTTDIEYHGKLNSLWDPFVRGEDSRTGKGTGLGLAIVSSALDRHKWKYHLTYDKKTRQFSCTIKIPFGLLF